MPTSYNLEEMGQFLEGWQTYRLTHNERKSEQTKNE